MGLNLNMTFDGSDMELSTASIFTFKIFIKRKKSDESQISFNCFSKYYRRLSFIDLPVG